MKKLITSFILLAIYGSLSLHGVAESSSAFHMASHALRLSKIPRVSDLIPSTGYQLDEHFVHTDDGHILRLFKLSSPLSSPRHHPVLLIHGLLDSCSAFLITGPKRALAFVLADAGYDVWLMNARGSTQSRNASYLNPDDPATSAQYWRFSFDEMARCDLPATLSKIEDQMTGPGRPRISVIGHSQGGTIILAALASQPLLADRLDKIILMAPVAFASHLESLVLLALVELDQDFSGLQLYELLGNKEFLPNTQVVKIMASQFCSVKLELCIDLLSIIAGVSEIDKDIVPNIIAFSPSGTSVENIIHWTQMIRERRPVFSMMDFGSDCSSSRCNQRAYSSPDPPQYVLSSIRSKLMVLHGSKDKLSTRLDIELLRESLPPRSDWIEIEGFEHLDFTWGSDASDKVYGLILNQLEGRR
jgi:lysosomal acid lipase/cholesteryl ester hydrolase